MEQAVHGGEFFEAIGEDFAYLERSKDVINADVLDAWFDPSPKIIEKVRAFLPFILKTSPPTHSAGLIHKISEVRGIAKPNIIAAGGSSDLIFAFFRLFVRSGHKIVLLDPTYGEYAHLIRNLVQAELRAFQLYKENRFRLDVDELIAFVRSEKPDFVIIVNPNSPSGAHVPKQELQRLIASVPEDTTVVLDETYIEYAGTSESLEQEAGRSRNLVIIKSMSKVYALSGVRVGYLVAHQDTIEKLSAIIPPWAVSLIGQIAGVEALKDEAYYTDRYRQTHELRKEFAEQLSRIPSLVPYESVANFFLVELTSPELGASMIYDGLRRKNIFVRNPDSMSSSFRNKFIRIAVKSKAQNEAIVAALAALIEH